MLLPAGVGANHDPDHAASGDWLMTFPPTPGRADTGKLHLAFSSKANYEAKAATLRYGTWAAGECGTNATQFYVGTFTRDKDSGLVVGCLSQGPSGLFYGVFQSTVYKVEGGLAGTLGAVMTAGVFPSQPQDEFNSQFLGHFAGDGAAPEEEITLECDGSRTFSDTTPPKPRAICMIRRIEVVKDPAKPGDVPAMIPTTSKLALTDSTVYFSGTVSSNTVPALVVVQFPNGVSKDDVVVPDARLNVGVVCGKPTTANGRVVVLCRLGAPAGWKSPTQVKGRIVVGLTKVPEALAGAQLQVLIHVGLPLKPGQTARDWLSHNDTALNVQTAIAAKPAPPPAPPVKPVAAPKTNKNVITGEWRSFIPTGGTVPEARPLAFSNVDIHIASTAPTTQQPDLFATTVTPPGGDPYGLHLYLDHSVGTLYSGFLEPPSTQGVRDAVTLELIPANAFSDHYPALCAGFAAQAKAPVLCGPYKNSVIVLGARTRLSISRSNGGWARTTDLRVISNHRPPGNECSRRGAPTRPKRDSGGWARTTDLRVMSPAL